MSIAAIPAERFSGALMAPLVDATAWQSHDHHREAKGLKDRSSALKCFTVRIKACRCRSFESVAILADIILPPGALSAGIRRAADRISERRIRPRASRNERPTPLQPLKSLHNRLSSRAAVRRLFCSASLQLLLRSVRTGETRRAWLPCAFCADRPRRQAASVFTDGRSMVAEGAPMSW